MRRQYHGVTFAIETADEIPQGLSQFHIHTRCRLIQHDDGRLVYQSLRNQHTPLHSTRQGAHIAVGLGREVEVVHHLINPGIIVVNPEVAGLHAQRFTNGEERIKDQLLRHNTNALARMTVVRDDIMAMNAHPTFIGAREPGDDGNQGRFAGAVGAQQAKELAFSNLERYTAQRLQGAEALFDMINLDGGHGGRKGENATRRPVAAQSR